MRTLADILNRPGLCAPPVLLAPMAGVTDVVFRELCLKIGADQACGNCGADKGCGTYGADFTYTEMVSAKGFSYGNEKTYSLISTSEAEQSFGKCGVQLFGSDPYILSETARKIEDEYGDKIALIDINMGCPARKIVANGDGSALMNNPKLAMRIISEVKKATRLPVTVKFRKGFDEAHVNAVEFAVMAEESGADMLTVHGRTREQMYSGESDREIIADVKRRVKIPVIANGDVVDGKSGLALLKYTGADGIMVARGARGNPFIFEEIKCAIAGSPYKRPTQAQIVKTAILHARRHVEIKGERHTLELRKHLSWYTRGMDGSNVFRTRINACETLDEMVALLEELVRQG